MCSLRNSILVRAHHSVTHHHPHYLYIHLGSVRIHLGSCPYNRFNPKDKQIWSIFVLYLFIVGMVFRTRAGFLSGESSCIQLSGPTITLANAICELVASTHSPVKYQHKTNQLPSLTLLSWTTTEFCIESSCSVYVCSCSGGHKELAFFKGHWVKGGLLLKDHTETNQTDKHSHSQSHLGTIQSLINPT